jgi:hypothetical protein
LRDSDSISEVRWVECRPDAPALPFPSVILSRDLEPDRMHDSPIGEVTGAARPFTGQRAPVGIDGSGYCGTASEFDLGGYYRPDLPAARYSADGWLACCGGPRRIRGGAAAGGRADYAVHAPLARRGGAAAGGRADYSAVTWVDATAGGAQVGGSAGDLVELLDATAGGAQVGGSAGDLVELLDATAGGAQVGGSAGDLVELLDATAGGAQVGGSAGDVLSGAGGVEGGAEVGGSAGDVLSGAGGVEGGAEVGGSAGDVFSGSGGGGLSCSTASVIALSTLYAATTYSMGGQWWFLSGLTPSASYHVTTTNVGGMSGAAMNGFAGVSCAFQMGIAFTNTVPNCYGFTADPQGNLWLEFFPPISGAVAYTFRVDAGTC